MNCEICFEPFDHSIRKPYSLSSCSHTYCLSCLQKLINKKCPECNKTIKEKNPNNALLRFIPESNYDKLKSETLKAWINLNEIKQNLKSKRQEKLEQNRAKLISTKKLICDETTKLINNLRQNEEILLDECNLMLDDLNVCLDSNKFEEKFTYEIVHGTKERVEKNELKVEDLNILNFVIKENKQELNELSEQIKHFDYKYEFVPNKILKANLLIGKINYKTTNKRLEYLLNRNDDSITYDDTLNYDSDTELENPSVNHGGIYFIRYEIERYVNAILCLQSILIDLNELGNYFSNGAALFCLKKFEDAIQYFNDAIENNPDFKKAIKSRKIDFKIDVKKR